MAGIARRSFVAALPGKSLCKKNPASAGFFFTRHGHPDVKRGCHLEPSLSV